MENAFCGDMLDITKRTEAEMIDDEDIGDTVADRSLRIVTALSAEVVVLQARLEMLERVAAANGVLESTDPSGFGGDAAIAGVLKTKRQEFIERVFSAMRA